MSTIGSIEVVRHATEFTCKKMKRMKNTDFDQANKKDANAVTGGKHTMSTTKKGQLVTVRQQPYARRNAYKLGVELGRLNVQYHPAHTLQVSAVFMLTGLFYGFHSFASGTICTMQYYQVCIRTGD